ncbi:MAG: YqgE/AlgH family protein [Pseudomonadota bacterium]
MSLASRYFSDMTHPDFPSVDLSLGFAGRLILAMPHLDDSPFAQSVVLICSHDDDHAFGVILNKPIRNLNVADALSDMDIEGSEDVKDVPVFFGGPVDMERGAVIHSLDYRTDATLLIAEGIGLTATKDALTVICQPSTAPRNFMLMMGHAGWAADQLDDEIRRNAWLSTLVTPDLVFGAPENAWSEALGHLGISDVSRLSGAEDEVVRPN